MLFFEKDRKQQKIFVILPFEYIETAKKFQFST